MVTSRPYKMQAPPPVAAPLVVSTMQSTRTRDHYMSQAVLGLSVTQIIIGTQCILFQLILIRVQSPLHPVGQGIWAGFFFVLTGAFGIASSKRKTTCLIVTFLILAILSAVLTVGILTASSFDMLPIFYEEHEEDYYRREKAMVINLMMLILAFSQAVVAIVSSALGCHGLCGGNRKEVVVAGQVQYVQGPDGQQQMVILPFNQQGAGLATGPSCPPGQTQLPPYDQDSPPAQYEGETKLPIPE